MFMYSNYDIYLGEFRFGMREGYGVYKSYNSKQWYLGEFKANTRHGKGKVVFPDGRVLQALWSKGEPVSPL